MGAMHVGCYKQTSAIKEGVIMRLQCNLLKSFKSIKFVHAFILGTNMESQVI